ncbi:MAG: hypothetical protein PVF27_06230 [Gemmatimonadales bacterium]|jgi:hypothetical protein
MRPRIVVALVVLALAPASTIVAQDGLIERPLRAAERGGFWFAFTGGVGRQYALHPVPCDPGFGPCPERDGFALGARIGGSAGSQVLWGFEFLKWCWSGDGGCPTGTAENLTFGITWFPSRTSWLHLRGGIGAGITSTQEVHDHATVATTFALGYDFRIARVLHLTPEIQLMCQGRNCGQDYLLLTLALTRY